MFKIDGIFFDNVAVAIKINGDQFKLLAYSMADEHCAEEGQKSAEGHVSMLMNVGLTPKRMTPTYINKNSHMLYMLAENLGLFDLEKRKIAAAKAAVLVCRKLGYSESVLRTAYSKYDNRVEAQVVRQSETAQLASIEKLIAALIDRKISAYRLKSDPKSISASDIKILKFAVTKQPVVRKTEAQAMLELLATTK